MSERPFSTRAAYWLGGVMLLSLLTFVFVAAYGLDTATVDSVGPDPESRSAIGHRGFVAFLDEAGVPVTVSRYASAYRAGEEAALVVAEPDIQPFQGAKMLTEMLERASSVLLVLPKWLHRRDPEERAYVDRVWERPVMDVEAVLSAAGVKAEVVRISAAEAEWEPNPLGPDPVLPFPQLLASEELTPIVACSRGVLLGEVSREGRRLMILSDPDLISNHGLIRGDNAALILGVIDAIRERSKPVFVDATLHGRRVRPSVWRELFRFPLILAVAQALFVLSLILWAATGRFGAPPPEAPAVAPGKNILIENTSQLLLFGGHSPEALQRYLAATVAEVGRALHAPLGLRGTELERWLDRLAKRRGVRDTPFVLRQEVGAVRGSRGSEAARVVDVAVRIHRMKKEILHGSRSSSRRD